MAMIDKLWLVTLTKNEDNAGTDTGGLNLTINIDGEDVVDHQFGFMGGSGGHLGPDSGWLSDGQAAISGGPYGNPGFDLSTPIDSSLLTNSSIRVGIRSDDAWGPDSILVLGNTQRRIIALAMETELESWLSTDTTEGKLTMPIRMVSPGTSSTVIRRVLLLTFTGSGIDVETDSRLVLEITAGGSIALVQELPDTPQDDQEQYTANWYVLDAEVPFTRGDVLSNGGIKLVTLGDDAWVPTQVFIYGLDTAEGRPNEVVHLVSIVDWDLGALSTDHNEGKEFVPLPVV
jgi:hypothetical protein